MLDSVLIIIIIYIGIWMINLRGLGKSIVLVFLLLSVLACSSTYSTWSTLGYSIGQHNEPLKLIGGRYEYPLLQFDNGIFVWITPNNIHQLKNKSDICKGIYEKLNINFWSLRESVEFDIKSSYIQLKNGKKHNIKYFKDLNSTVESDVDRVKLINDLKLRDKSLLQTASKANGFIPTEDIMKKSTRIQVTLEPSISCSSEGLELYLTFNNGIKKVSFYPIVFTELNR
jgi:hypothetical protein